MKSSPKTYILNICSQPYVHSILASGGGQMLTEYTNSTIILPEFNFRSTSLESPLCHFTTLTSQLCWSDSELIQLILQIHNSPFHRLIARIIPAVFAPVRASTWVRGGTGRPPATSPSSRTTSTLSSSLTATTITWCDNSGTFQIIGCLNDFVESRSRMLLL